MTSDTRQIWSAQFYERARALQQEARLFLLAAIMLLIAGGVIFYFAPLITSFDFKGDKDLDARINENQQAIQSNSDAAEPLRSEVNSDRSKWAKEVEKIIDDTKKARATDLLGPPFTMPPPNISMPFPFSPTDMAKDIRGLVDDDKYDTINVSVGLRSGIIIKTLSKKGWLDVASKLDAMRGPSSDESAKITSILKDINRRDYNAGLLQGVADRLRQQKIDYLANKRINVDGTADNINPGLRIIQTSITRFGTLAIVSFLAAICLPLYRYNMRLAAFYIARGDVMKITQLEDSKSNDFATLLVALTPNFDYGKSPSTPTAQVIDVLKAATSLKLS